MTTNVLNTVFRRLLEGDAQWGSLTIQPDRFGTRYFLIVYPPGTTVAERRRIRIWRGWPIWGAALWIVSEIALSGQIDPWHALAVSTSILLAAGAVAFMMAGRARGRVRTMGATLLPRHCDPISQAACTRMSELTDRLREAEAQRTRGFIDSARFELAWWQVYNDMAAHAPSGARDSSSGAAQ